MAEAASRLYVPALGGIYGAANAYAEPILRIGLRAQPHLQRLNELLVAPFGAVGRNQNSGRQLAVIELAASLKLLLFVSLIACIFVPWGLVGPEAGLSGYIVGGVTWVRKLAVGGVLLAFFETVIAKMRVFRVPIFLGAALMLGLLGTLLLFVSRSL